MDPFHNKARMRFWRSVRKTASCWIWAGQRHRTGYGKFYSGGLTHLAHRYSYQLATECRLPRLRAGNGTPYVLHSCNNKWCVNPSHLRLGTHQENVADAVRDGCLLRGEMNPRATHSAEEILAMRAMWDAGKTKAQIRRAFGTKANLTAVIHGETWAYLPAARRPVIEKLEFSPEARLQIVELARERLLTQREIAAAVGCNHNTIGQMHRRIGSYTAMRADGSLPRREVSS